MLKNKFFPKCYRVFVFVFSLLFAFSAHSFTFTQVDIPLLKNDQIAPLKITIHASHSLKNKLTPILKEFEPPEGVELQVIYTASTLSAKQLELGSPIDLIISDSSHAMLQLQRFNWVSEITPLWENRLVLIRAPKSRQTRFGQWDDWGPSSASEDNLAINDDSPNTEIPNQMVNFDVYDKESWMNLFSDKIKNKARVGLADPLSSALGMYTEQTLSNLKIPSEFLDDSIYYFDSQITLSSVLDRQVDYAIVYYSDIVNIPDEQVIAVIPNSVHSPIIYQVAQVDQEQSNLKKKVLNALTDYLSDTSVSMKMLDGGFTIALPDTTSQNNTIKPIGLIENISPSMFEKAYEDINILLDGDVILDIPSHIQPLLVPKTEQSLESIVEPIVEPIVEQPLEPTKNLEKENTNE